jgi:hypothetical protein
MKIQVTKEDNTLGRKLVNSGGCPACNCAVTQAIERLLKPEYCVETARGYVGIYDKALVYKDRRFGDWSHRLWKARLPFAADVLIDLFDDGHLAIGEFDLEIPQHYLK